MLKLSSFAMAKDDNVIDQMKKKSAMDEAMARTLEAMDDTPKVVNIVQRPAMPLVFRDKREAMEALKDLLRDKQVPSSANWESALKMIQKDARWETLSKLTEKKQAFNAYKIQKQKEEKEEARLLAIKNKADLEQFLMSTERMASTVKYYRCEEIFMDIPLWKSVPDAERREIYLDVVHNLSKKEKEEAKVLRKKNQTRLANILDQMTKVDHRTTWEQCQQMLLDSPAFADDDELLAMDKEDALIAFEDHIRELEKEEEQEKDKEKKRTKRLQRKNRDAMNAVLDELHEQGKLTSMSLWVELYPVVSRDPRFHALLGQPGSTPLDLFKFYVEDLKARFHDEKKVVKEILKEKGFFIEISTTYESFSSTILSDKRSSNLDSGNIKLTYNSLLEKAEAREKERLKEEARRLKKLESNFKNLLAKQSIDLDTKWEVLRPKIETETAFMNITLEAERIRLFKEHLIALEESCSHYHPKKKKKKDKHRSRRSRSRSQSSDSDEDRHRSST